MKTKKCRKCGVIKPESEFHTCKANKDGLHSYCKNCKRIYNYEHGYQKTLVELPDDVTKMIHIPLDKFTNKQLFAELKSRGFSGKLQLSKNYEL